MTEMRHFAGWLRGRLRTIAGLVAVGGPVAVKKAIDTKAAGGQNATDNDELMRLIRDVDDGTVWAVAKFDAIAGSRLPREFAGKLPQISWFSVKGVVGSGIDGQVRAEARDDAAAQDLRQVVQGFMALGLVVVLGLVVAGMGIVGDLDESLLKRWAGVKDSGTLFPGHGGMLDRLDSLLFGAPVLYYYFQNVR